MRDKPWRTMQVASVLGAHCELYHCLPGERTAFPAHLHRQYQFYFNHDLPYWYRYAGRRHLISPSSVSVLHPGIAHAGEDTAARTTASTFRIMYIEPQYVHSLAADLMGVRTQQEIYFPELLPDNRGLTALFSEVHQSILESPYPLEKETVLLELIRRLLEHAPSAHALVVPKATRKQAGLVARRAQQYLNDFYADPVSLAQLAKECNVSAPYLHHVFRQYYGIPPHAYHLNIRIEHAKTMLMEKHSLGRVAQDLGFSDQSHFTRHFKRLVGVTPAQYLVSK